MGTIFRQISTTLRGLVRSPLVAVVAVLTLAVGIGAAVAVFSVVHGVLLKPLPFEDADRLVSISHEASGLGMDRLPQAPALYFIYREQSEAFEDSGLWDDGTVTVTGLAEPEEVDAIFVTDGTLPLLRAKPQHGRLFSAEDDSPDGEETVILSHGYWQKRFGGDPAAVGKALMVDGRPRAIVGILEAGLDFLDSDPALFLPFRLDRDELFFGQFSFNGIARLGSGISTAAAEADLARLLPVALDSFPMPAGFTKEMAREAGIAPSVRPLREEVVGDVGKVLWVLLGTVGLVLLIACVNVANLLLVRAEGRQRELAIRSALGAGRAQIGFSLLLESGLLAMAGGLAGLGLAQGGIRLLTALAPRGLPRVQEISIDGTVLAAALGVTGFAALLSAALPMLRLASTDLVSSLNEGSRGASSSRGRNRTRNVLVTAQIALALVLMIGCGLMVRSFVAMQGADPGFRDPEEVLTFRLSIPSAEVEDPAEVARLHEEILTKLQALPGVSSVGLTTSVTMDGWNSNDPIFFEDFPVPEAQIPPLRRFKWISPGYFETMGNPLIAGRSISWADIHDRSPVAVVTENLAREYWPEPAQAIGHRIRPYPDSPWREIVGVVGNILDEGPDREAPAVVFWPMAQESFFGEGTQVQRTLAYVLRSSRVGGQGLLNEVQSAVWSSNSQLPLAGVRTLEEIVERNLSRSFFTVVMLLLAAAVALLLGAIGIYGVTSYVASQRTREIGVRMAFGARPQDVRRLVLRHGLVLASFGVLAGVAAAFGLTRLMSALLFGVSASDLPTYVVGGFAVALIALIATYLPARRAAALDPIRTLRAE
ncbi:MAG: ABC transporter permease [Acidobacteria bacterium]|nr:ABC transporter permease [Acidobacteriota bacterium]